MDRDLRYLDIGHVQFGKTTPVRPLLELRLVGLNAGIYIVCWRPPFIPVIVKRYCLEAFCSFQHVLMATQGDIFLVVFTFLIAVCGFYLRGPDGQTLNVRCCHKRQDFRFIAVYALNSYSELLALFRRIDLFVTSSRQISLWLSETPSYTPK